MNVLMIGTLITDEVSTFCYEKGVKVSAADIAQKYMLHGLEAIDDVSSVDIIGAVRVKAWPKVSITSFKEDSQQITKGVIHSVGYSNLPGIGFYLRERAIVTAAIKWANAHKNDSDVMILIYSMHSPFMNAAKTVKKIIPHAKIVLTVADLPLFMDMRGSLRRFLKNIDWKRIRSLMPYVDKYLLYTKYMAEYLQLEKNQWMVFEGLIDEKRIVTSPSPKNDEKKCLYAGNLDARYGIDMLIEAFKKVKCEAKLCIYGASINQNRIAEIVSDIPNVEFMGQVSQDQIFEVMKTSDLLINPRPSAIGLAKYSCPSKTFEYMASGTPTLMNHLPGLPDEYEPYVYFFSEETVEGYAVAIDEFFASSQEERRDFGIRAAAFLKEKKNSTYVMQKVCEFVHQAKEM